jgi:hypothetical protein
MLTRTLGRLADDIFLKVSGGDSIRADELRSRATGLFLTFVMISYVPLVGVVILLVMNRPTPVDEIATADQLDAVKAYAVQYVDVYLKDPSNSDAIKQFYDGDIPTSALPPGGRALRAASCLPGVFADGYQTYSVLVDAEVPKAAHAAAMVAMKLQVDISADTDNRFRAFTLPHARPARQPGRSVELATQMTVSPDRPVFMTVKGFLGALLTRQGDLAPFVAAGSTLTPEPAGLYATLSVERVQANSEVGAAQDVPQRADDLEVTARAIVQTASGVSMPMDFPLVMSVAGGHWQVDRINDAPGILAPPTSDSAPTGAPSTTSSPTTAAPHTHPGSTQEGNEK